MGSIWGRACILSDHCYATLFFSLLSSAFPRCMQCVLQSLGCSFTISMFALFSNYLWFWKAVSSVSLLIPPSFNHINTFEKIKRYKHSFYTFLYLYISITVGLGQKGFPALGKFTLDGVRPKNDNRMGCKKGLIPNSIITGRLSVRNMFTFGCPSLLQLSVCYQLFPHLYPCFAMLWS